MRTPILPAMLTATLLAACSHESPTMPLALEPSRVASAMGGTQTHGIELVALLGTGSGAVNVTPTAEDQGTFHGKHYERCCYKATPFANAYCIQFVNGTQVSVGKETSASTPPPPPPPVFTPPTANAPAQ